MLGLQAGWIVRAPFVFSNRRQGESIRPMQCVVMASHAKGILILPIVKDRPVNRDWAVRLASGASLHGRFVICDRRNVVYSPQHYLIAHLDRQGTPKLAEGRLATETFEQVRQKMLECCDQGRQQDIVIRADPEAAEAPGSKRPEDHLSPRFRSAQGRHVLGGIMDQHRSVVG